jgi:transcriptional regulator with XRE-family HTH domain
MGNPIDTAVGERIRQLRKERQITQSELAAAIGLTFQQVQKYEKARNRISAGKLVDIANALGVEVIELFEGLDQASHNSTDERTQLIQAFEKMDPDLRQHLLTLITAISAKQ